MFLVAPCCLGSYWWLPSDEDSGPSPEDVVATLRSAIEDLIAATPTLIPKFVRLSFHDCVGGCDGCVDLQNPENAGLFMPIVALGPICEKEPVGMIPAGAGVSRADCWALAALTASEVAQDSTYFAFSLEKIGRQDCEAVRGIGGPERPMPTAHAGLDELVDFFDEWFGLNHQEIVALMGAHTLGGAYKANSGYSGVWTSDPLALNNYYYIALDNVWSQKVEQEANGHFQWELLAPPDMPYETSYRPETGCPVLNLPGYGPPPPPDTDWDACQPLFMLNVDVCMHRDFNSKLNQTSGMVDCLWVDQPDDFDARKPCKDSKLMPWVLAYRDNNWLWVRDYEQVLTKVLNTKAPPLRNADGRDADYYSTFT